MSRPTFKSLPAPCRLVEPPPRPATPTLPPAGTSVPPAPVASREGAKTNQRRRSAQKPPPPRQPPETAPKQAEAEHPARPRPAYHYTQWPGTSRWRFAAHDLSPAQLACLEAAAAQCGIRNANPTPPTP